MSTDKDLNIVYKQKLILLIIGYIREISQDNHIIPNDIINSINQWYGDNSPTITCTKITHFHCEFLIDHNKVLNINQFKCCLNVTDLYSQHTQWNGYEGFYVEYLECMNKEYGVTFIKLPIPKLFGDINTTYLYKYTLIGLDKDDNILFSGTGSFNACFWVPATCRWSYFEFNFIDRYNKGYVTLDEWIMAMKRLGINGNEIVWMRIFCWMNYIKYGTQKDSINKQQFYDLLLSDDPPGMIKNKEYSMVIQQLENICTMHGLHLRMTSRPYGSIVLAAIPDNIPREYIFYP